MSVLSARKGVLTRHQNSLISLINENQQLLTPLTWPADPQLLRTFIQERTATYRLPTTKLETVLAKAEGAINDFATVMDQQTDATEKEQELADAFITKAQEVIQKAEDIYIHLKGMLDVLASRLKDDSSTTTAASGPITVEVKTPDTHLRINSLPSFNGNVLEWDLFWSIFEDYLNGRTYSDLQKFHLLLQSLKGEAANCLSRYCVTADNYATAVSFLKKKYGDPEKVKTNLYNRLEQTKPHSSSTKDQRTALDQIFAIANQLSRKQEDMNSTWALNSVLAKFSEAYQRKTLTKKIASTAPWTMDLLLETLDRIISEDELISSLVSKPNDLKGQTKKQEDRQQQAVVKDKKKFAYNCFYCPKTDHRPDDCPDIVDPKLRAEELRKQQRCTNCGSLKHQWKDCTSGGCRKCDKKHHTSTCYGNSKQKSSSTQPADTKVLKSSQEKKPTSTGKKHGTESARQYFAAAEEDYGEDSDSNVVLHLHRDSVQPNDEVIILTGQAQILDPRTHEVRPVQILLDTGAQLSFISTSLADELDLPITGQRSLKLQTFGSEQSIRQTYTTVMAQVQDLEGNIYEFNLMKRDVLTSALPQAQLSYEDWNFITENRIVLSRDDTETHIKPQILLGCDYLWSMLKGEPHLTLPSGLLLVSSKMGHLVTGTQMESKSDICHINTIQVDNSSFEEAQRWEAFFQLESTGVNEFPGTKQMEQSLIDQQVLHNFKETIQHHSDGYYVRLPWKDDQDPLPDNRPIAQKRLESVLRAYRQKPDILEQYDNTFKDQLKKGIIEEVNEEEPSEGIIHYLPHQAVITPHKETTKLRVVFDASAHFKGKPCLNDVLHQGPLILPEMVGMILRFRLGNIAMASDVEKAFLQVRLQKIDRDATRCLWIRDVTQPITPSNLVIYRFTRVTFGLNTSPFLLAATIDHHLDTIEDFDQSLYANEIRRNLYVDNLLLSASTEAMAIAKYKVSKSIFDAMNMNLREHISNNQEVNNLMDEADRASNPQQKILGIFWDTVTDTLLLQSQASNPPNVTKRVVSQQIASIYDPLGWRVPLLLRAKIFLQELWKKELDWDDCLPDDMSQYWKRLIGQITAFDKSLPRKIQEADQQHTLVAFSDASEEAMAACVYLVGPHNSHLVMAKSKLPSIKSKMTMPKLEMNALCMATRMVHYVVHELKGAAQISYVVLFSDSQIALSWLKKAPGDGSAGVLVRNRVNEIRQLVDTLTENDVQVQFGYVNTKENPADIASRGVDCNQTDFQEFADHMWWTGPDFLHNSAEEWGQTFSLQFPTGDETTETCQDVHHIAILPSTPEQLGLARYSSLTKAKRIMVRALRFIKKSARHLEPKWDSIKDIRFDGYIRSEEMGVALKILVRQHQKDHVNTASIKSMKDLNLQQDHEMIWRCEGRMAQSELHPEAQSPIFIAPKTNLARLIIADNHSCKHPGVAATVASVRKSYWIPKLRQQVRSATTKCVPCQKFNNLPYAYPKMRSLPSQRVRRSHPFEHTGLDYFGPLKVTGSEGNLRKVYGCIFTCMATRLIHLDVANDMSTESFINVVRRFYSRRGIPASITSDNAPQFILGEEILQELMQKIKDNEDVANMMANRAISWRFITPYAPWQGGFYERLIQTIKHALYKSIGKQTLTQDQMQTVLIEVESTINSRPLTYQEERWDQQPILRPIDFLQKDIQLHFPLEFLEPDQNDSTYLPPEEALVLKTRHDAEQALKNSHQNVEIFWKIWHNSYLTSLREQHKVHMHNKKGSAQTPRINSVVLLMDSNMPRNQWKLARITKLKPNAEGVIREVEVTTPAGRILRRPVNLLVPMELGGDDNQQPSLNLDNDDSPATTASSLPADNARYNLRNRKNIDYSEEDSPDEKMTHMYYAGRSTQGPSLGLFPFLFALLCIFAGTSASPVVHSFSNSSATVSCIPGGVSIISHNIHWLEVCAESFCRQWNNPSAKETVNLPAEIVLHKHVIKWKMSNSDETISDETTCLPAAFCSQVNCILCTALLMNPECWPVGAIVGLAFLIYVCFTMCYVILYVPFVVGRPIRAGANALWITVSFLCWICYRGISWVWNTIMRRRRASRLSRILGIWLTLITVTEACQKLNVFSHSSTICTRTSPTHQMCAIETTEVIKINPFHQEACMKIVSNTSTLTEIRIRWKKLILRCEAESILFTRHTAYKVIDSKRCAHTGSCVNSKCASIYPNSAVPELQKGQDFPGNTYCVSSCGGPGCDCFYLSSGCLFYRIFLLPQSSDVYELFKCTRWKESVELEVTRMTSSQNKPEITTLEHRPNVPMEIGSMELTLSTVTVPPLPILHTQFITNGNNTALWNSKALPPLQCSSMEEALALNCTVIEDCLCTPAEATMKCRCNDINISSRFKHGYSRLPVTTPAVVFRQGSNGSVFGEITNMATAEIILNLNDNLSVATEVTETTCTITDTVISGCYNCPKGAYASVICTSTDQDVTAEVDCETTSFSLPCSQKGSKSEIGFSLDRARIRLSCSVKCGSRKKHFGITGILKYANTLDSAYRRLINGESTFQQEISLPDFGHILDVYFQWYKLLLFAGMGIALALLFTYVVVTTFGATILSGIFRLFFRILRGILGLILGLFCKLLPARSNRATRTKLEEKLL